MRRMIDYIFLAINFQYVVGMEFEQKPTEQKDLLMINFTKGPEHTKFFAQLWEDIVCILCGINQFIHGWIGVRLYIVKNLLRML